MMEVGARVKCEHREHRGGEVEKLENYAEKTFRVYYLENRSRLNASFILASANVSSYPESTFTYCK